MASGGNVVDLTRQRSKHQALRRRPKSEVRCTAQADTADVYVFDGAEGLLIEVTPQPDNWPQIHAAWDAFMRCVSDGQPPALTARDTRVRDDPEWLSAAAAYLEAKRAADTIGTALDEAKARLIGIADHAKEQGGGVSVTRMWKRGGVEYKRVPELVGVDLEQYRGAAREEVRVLIER